MPSFVKNIKLRLSFAKFMELCQVYENRFTKSGFVSTGFTDSRSMKTGLPNPALCQLGVLSPGVRKPCLPNPSLCQSGLPTPGL
jgi:hypothetical protein